FRHQVRASLQQPSALWIEHVGIPADLVDGPPHHVGGLGAVLTRHLGTPDHVVDDVAPAHRLPAAPPAVHVIDFLDLDGGHVPVLGEADGDALDLAPPVGGSAFDEDVLGADDQVG